MLVAPRDAASDDIRDPSINRFIGRIGRPRNRAVAGGEPHSIGGAIGGAAILQWKGHPQSILQLHLGTDKQHTVFEGELIGILLALHLLSSLRLNADAIIYTDNQAAFRALNNTTHRSAGYLIQEI